MTAAAAALTIGRPRLISQIALDAVEQYSNEPMSFKRLGDKVGIKAGTIGDAAYVVKHGEPELLAAVREGKLNLNAASKIATLPRPEQAGITERAVVAAAEDRRGHAPIAELTGTAKPRVDARPTKPKAEQFLSAIDRLEIGAELTTLNASALINDPRREDYLAALKAVRAVLTRTITFLDTGTTS